MTDRAARLRDQLVDELTREGALRSPAWTEAFQTVPRHEFLPRYFRLTEDGSRFEAIDELHADWLPGIYQNSVLPTQLDGDDRRWLVAREQGPVAGLPTCSSTQPSLMAVMLEALDVRDGDTVLEIGTGTGYNAALLCHRLGDQNVTSVDIDQGLADSARRQLAGLGYEPRIVAGDGTAGDGTAGDGTAGDGTAGYPWRASYDRLIATCAVTTIPPAWLTQVRPGGVIVASIHRDLGGGLLARLVVGDDGTATGWVLDDPGYFMPLRCEASLGTVVELVRAAASASGETCQPVLPGLPDDTEPWYALAAVRLPQVGRLDVRVPEGVAQWLVAPDGSWAYYDTQTGLVEQAGPRRLWTEIEEIFQTLPAPISRRCQIRLSVSRTDPILRASGPGVSC